MRRFGIFALVVFSVLGLTAPAQGSKSCDPRRQKCPAAAVRFKNCTELRKVHPRGVARDAAAAGGTGATVAPATYKANAGSDRDKDGIACES